MVIVDIIKNGLLKLNKLVSFQNYLALFLVILAVVLYLKLDRTQQETVEAERSSMYEQQGGSYGYSNSASKSSHGYGGDWEWDTADEDDEAMKHLLAQEEDQSRTFLIENQVTTVSV